MISSDDFAPFRRSYHLARKFDSKFENSFGGSDGGELTFECPTSPWSAAILLTSLSRQCGQTKVGCTDSAVASVPELEKRGRTDITYFSNGIDPALEFVLECKKLKPSSQGKASRREYAKNGVLRFVNGIYARGTDLGFMVGFVEHDSDVKSISTALSRMIQEPDMSSLLRTIINDQGNAITSPARSFKACAFETYHARDHAKDSPDMVLGHLILSHRP